MHHRTSVSSTASGGIVAYDISRTNLRNDLSSLHRRIGSHTVYRHAAIQDNGEGGGSAGVWDQREVLYQYGPE